jgi:hypothetical protein
MRLSAIIKIVCLRKRPNLIADRTAYASLSLPGPGRETSETPMEFERRSIARTTISKDALLFFERAARRPDLPRSGRHEFRRRNRTPQPQFAAAGFELSFDNFHTIRGCRVIWRQGDFVGVAFQN